ncbi:MAG: tetratricopeptide repeat protein [Calditrichaeota bacterium]|nr:tetratricopeptide repeat protein [Calditrichota bacterium]
MKHRKNIEYLPVLLVFTAIISIGCSSGRQTRTVSETNQPAFLYYQTAMDYLKNQDYALALDQMNKAISLKPEYAPFYYARGQILELQGDVYKAINSYEHALRYKSYYPDTWKRLTKLYTKAGQYDKAAQILNYLTDSFPDSLRYELDLADAYIDAKKPLLALERVNYFGNQGGMSDEVLRIKGLAHFHLEDCKKALDYLERYAEKHPDNLRVLKHLGIAYIKTGDPEKGVTYLNKALSLDPNDPEIYLYRAKYFIQMKKFDTARDQYRLAFELDNTNSKVLLESSLFYMAQGDTLAAEKLLERAVRYDENCWECYKWLGIIADEKDDINKAVQYLEKYISNIFYHDEFVEKRLKRLKLLQSSLKNK